MLVYVVSVTFSISNCAFRMFQTGNTDVSGSLNVCVNRRRRTISESAHARNRSFEGRAWNLIIVRYIYLFLQFITSMYIGTSPLRYTVLVLPENWKNCIETTHYCILINGNDLCVCTLDNGVYMCVCACVCAMILFC